MNNVMIFENHEVEVFEFNGEVLFNPYHVGRCLDIDDVTVRRHMQKMNDKQVIVLKNSDFKEFNFSFRKLNNRGESFLTQKGLLLLISRNRKTTEKKREKFVNFLKSNNLINADFAVISRKEIEFMEELRDFLTAMGLKLKTQYNVLGFKVDGYIPVLNIAIEYDEKGHANYSYDAQEGRQIKIENEIGCKFVRLSECDSNAYNIGVVANKIMEVKYYERFKSFH